LDIDCGTDLACRYADQLVASLRCFDRVIMHGTPVDVAHPGALVTAMQAAGFKPRDLARFAQPITTQVRDHIIGLARSFRAFPVEYCGLIPLSSAHRVAMS
jgi:hypothetical protein